MPNVTLLCIGGCMDGKRITVTDTSQYFIAEHPCDTIFGDESQLEDKIPVSIQRYVKKCFRDIVNEKIQDVDLFVYKNHDKGIIESLIEGYKS